MQESVHSPWGHAGGWQAFYFRLDALIVGQSSSKWWSLLLCLMRLVAKGFFFLFALIWKCIFVQPFCASSLLTAGCLSLVFWTTERVFFNGSCVQPGPPCDSFCLLRFSLCTHRSLRFAQTLFGLFNSDCRIRTLNLTCAFGFLIYKKIKSNKISIKNQEEKHAVRFRE